MEIINIFESLLSRITYLLSEKIVKDFLNLNVNESMDALVQLEEMIKNQLPLLKEKYNVKSIGIFGKVEDNKDLDLLVEFENTQHPGYFKFYDMERYLSRILDMSVGLVPRDELRKRLDKHILADLVA